MVLTPVTGSACRGAARILAVVCGTLLPGGAALAAPPPGAGGPTAWRAPTVTYPAALDADGNRILDALDSDLVALPRGTGPVEVVVVLFDPPTDVDLAAFASLGGEVIDVWRHATNGWWGRLPPRQVPALPFLYGDRTCIVQGVDPGDGRADLDLATQMVRVRNQTWVTYGHEGDAEGSIAILDSGIDGAHDDLADPDGDNVFDDPGDWNDACTAGWNPAFRIQGWSWQTGTSANPVDTNGHGTAVAGCAAGDGTISSTLKGVAPLSHLVGARISNSSSTQAIAAMNRIIADRTCARIKAANLSSSYVPANPSLIMDAANNVVRNGIVLTCSAGNGFPGTDIAYPGQAPRAITVGATNDLDRLSGYSSNGPAGVAKPDLVAPGGGSGGTNGTIRTCDSNPDDAYVTAVGTSFSAPIVCGAASLLIDAWEQADSFSWAYTEFEARVIKHALLATATETDSPGENGNDTGAKDRGGHDRKEGYGRVNVDAAVEALTMSLAVDVLAMDTFGPAVTDKKAWAREVGACGPCVRAELQVPATGDYDLYLYEVPTPGPADTTGVPRLVGKSIVPGTGNLEVIERDIGFACQPMLLVVKRVSGSGQFSVRVLDDTISPSPCVGTSAPEVAPARNGRFSLDPARPNPFRPATILSYEIPRPARAALRIYDAAGRLVRELVTTRHHAAGRFQVRWDGRNDHGRLLGAGVYFSCLETAHGTRTRRLVMVR